MTILPIRIYGEPVLHEIATPVDAITDEVRELIADMYETMDLAPGVGLAAPQIGVSKRIFTYSWEDEDGTNYRGVAINPELWVSPAEPETLEPLDEDEEEGCLSVPGERFSLRRADHALMRALDIDGNPYEIKASGWFARILQHEFDHLDGVIYVDRLQLTLWKQAFKVMRKKGWNVPGQSWIPGVDNLED